MRVFTGPVISALAGKGGAGEVLVPDISTTDADKLLLPQVSQRRVICEGEDRLRNYPDRRYSMPPVYCIIGRCYMLFKQTI